MAGWHRDDETRDAPFDEVHETVVEEAEMRVGLPRFRITTTEDLGEFEGTVEDREAVVFVGDRDEFRVGEFRCR